MLLDFELALWRLRSRRPVLWWRDDDAQGDSPALQRLLTMAADHHLPLTLAVIPTPQHGWLHAAARRLAGLDVMQHGVTHRNLNAPGEAPSEFPPAIALDSMRAEIAVSAALLGGVPNQLPVFVPAWNRLTPALAALLPQLGFAAISGHERHQPELDTLPRLDVHLDLLRWGHAPRFRGEARFLLRLVRLLRDRRHAGRWDEPIGLLTHHRDHDAAAWAFLDTLLERLRERATWMASRALLAEQLAGPARLRAAA